MDKIIDIIDSIAYEKGLKISDVEEALKEAMVNTAKKMINEDLIFETEIDRKNKELKLYQKIEVVANDDERLKGTVLNEYNKPISAENFIPLSEAQEANDELEIGDFVQYDLEFDDMGRNAATILHNNFEYKIQRFIEENIFSKYKEKIGKIITANVTRVDSADNTFIEIGEVKGILPRKNRIKGEYFKVGDVIKAVVRTVKIDKNHGLIVEISRTSPKFLEGLLKLEVPELKDERIIIENSARIPGSRAKIALSTTDPSIDPIGSVVGVKGVRISAVSKELNGESIDCIEYTAIPEMFVARALSPAIISNVKIETTKQKEDDEVEKCKAIVSIPSDQKSKAIGKAGLNVRLASMLTKCDIELKEIQSSNSNDNIDNDKVKTADTTSLEQLFK
jgi:N utilization substance protein A